MKTIKAFISLLLLFQLSCFSAFGQTETSSASSIENLVKQANNYAQLILNKDSNSFVDKIYPKLVSIAGGREAVIEMTRKGFAQMESNGMYIDSVKFLKPNPIIETTHEWQTSMTELLLITVPNGKLVSKSTLICISPDKGITWYFLDTSGKTLEGMRAKFPNLSKKLIVEAPEEPIFIRK